MNIASSEIIENNNSKTLNRVSTKDEWALVNPVLQFGELGFEIDGQMTNIKMGNGVTPWNALPYISKQCPYDVGDIFYTENETHPSVRWPGTEWEALPGGHCLVAAGTNPNTGTVFHAGETGGEEKHQLTIGELAKHNHRGRILYNQKGYGLTSGTWEAYLTAFSGNMASTGANNGELTDVNARSIHYGSDAGSNQAHNNMMPYISLYIWKRIN